MGDMQQFFGGQGFDQNNVEPQKDFEVLPPGKYPVHIESAEIKATKAKTGHYIEVVCVILDGPAKGRKLWDRININNPNQAAVDIGQRCLAALGIAIGIQGQMTNTDQLLSGQCMAHVKVKEEQNEIRTYSSFAAFRDAEAKKTSGGAQRKFVASGPTGPLPSATTPAPAPDPGPVEADPAVAPYTASQPVPRRMTEERDLPPGMAMGEGNAPAAPPGGIAPSRPTPWAR